MDPLRHLRLAVRRLRATPLFTAAALSTLTLAVGTLVAAFAVISSVVLAPLPYPESGRLVEVGFAVPGFGFEEMPMSDATFLLARDAQRSFSHLAMYRALGGNNLGDADPERIQAAEVTPGFFDTFGTPPVLGRSFREEDARPGARPVVILGHALWQRRWGQDPDVVGRTVTLEGGSREIVGVAPQGFRFPEGDSEIWVPLTLDPASVVPRGFGYPGVARLAPGVSADAATRDLARLTSMAMEAYPDEFTEGWVENGRFGPYVKPLHAVVVGDSGTELWLMLGTAGLLLVLALANVANLFLVRGEGRAPELALRSALGAGGRRLWLNLLGESTTLAVAAGALGLVLAALLLVLLESTATGDLPRAREIGLGAGEAGLAGLVVLASIALFAFLPVLASRRRKVADTLRGGGRGSTSPGGTHAVQTGLVVGQVALAVALLVGAGLMSKSFGGLLGVDPGFEAESAVTFELGLPAAGYGPDDRARAWSAVTNRIGEMPGVDAAGGVTILPLDPFFQKVPVHVEGREASEEGSPPLAEIRKVTPGYFEAAGIGLREGRLLREEDGPGGLGAAVVNETLARSLLGDAPATEARFRIAEAGEYLQVVGVVADVRTVTLATPPEPEVYLPVDFTARTSPEVPSTLQLVVRTERPSATLFPALREAVGTVDGTIPVPRPVPLESIVAADTARERFLAGTLLLMAATGLLLALVGVYGLVAYVISGSRKEIGVRMALGAPRRSVWGRLVLRALVWGMLGVAAGLAAAGVGSRYLTSLLYRTEPLDPTIYLGAGLLLVLTAVLAAFLPAWKASGRDPAPVLREE